MTRLHVIVEGQTEEVFVRDVLEPYLSHLGIFSTPSVMGNRRRGRVHRGGMTSYQRLRGILDRRIKEDRGAHVTTMVDLYRLPKDFPEIETIRSESDPYRKVERLESAMARDLGEPRRFVPYVQLHEFEALVLVEPRRLNDFFPGAETEALVALCENVDSPERIDDGPETAPSKRIIREIDTYRDAKATLGPEITRRIGLLKLRERCPHFDAWITKLESLAEEDA